MYGGPQQPAFVTSITNLTGIDHCADLNGGDGDCVSYTPLSINWQDDDHRSSAATAYLSPVEDRRQGWLTLVGQQVTKINLSGFAPNVEATGVQFKSASNTGSTFTANARKEVIVAAGAIGTPQLLQLSGIGDPKVLNPLGINTVVNLPTVGRNLQEQSMSTLAHSAKSSFNPDGSGPSDCIAYPSLKELFSANGGSNGSVTADQVASHIMASYPAWAQKEAVNGLSAQALQTIFGIQAGLIVNDNGMLLHSTGLKNILTFLVAPVAELFSDTGYPE